MRKNRAENDLPTQYRAENDLPTQYRAENDLPTQYRAENGDGADAATSTCVEVSGNSLETRV